MAPLTASNPKITKKTVRNRPETALQSIAIRLLLKTSELNENHLLNLSIYKLLLKLYYKPSELNVIDLFKF